MRVKMSADEEWNKAAMVDDTMVAELLLQLNQETPAEPAEPPQPSPKPVLPLEWSGRQRRSKAVSVNSNVKKAAAPRASPTTPLSWSGATSGGSGGGGGGSGSGGVGVIDGGLEESSKPQLLPHHPKRAETTRSKGTAEATTSKRPRKKKTLAELKEEEITLLKERRRLKKELTTLLVNVEEERAINENLKRMKLDVRSQMENGSAITLSTRDAVSGGASDPPAHVLLTTEPADAASTQFSQPKSSGDAQKELREFVLPDLNLPFEDDCSTKVLCGVS